MVSSQLAQLKVVVLSGLFPVEQAKNDAVCTILSTKK
jgi:hypothetical protein